MNKIEDSFNSLNKNYNDKKINNSDNIGDINF